MRGADRGVRFEQARRECLDRESGGSSAMAISLGDVSRGNEAS